MRANVEIVIMDIVLLLKQTLQAILESL